MKPNEIPTCNANRPINVVMECGSASILNLANVRFVQSKSIECMSIVDGGL